MRTFAVSIVSLMDANEHSIFFVQVASDLPEVAATTAMRQGLLLFTKPEYREEQQEWIDGLPNNVEDFRCEVFNTDICIQCRELNFVGGEHSGILGVETDSL